MDELLFKLFCLKNWAYNSNISNKIDQ